MKNKIIVCSAFVAVSMFSMIIGWGLRDDSLKCEAVRLGHASWISDIDGHPEFKWSDKDRNTSRRCTSKSESDTVPKVVAEPHKP